MLSKYQLRSIFTHNTLRQFALLSLICVIYAIDDSLENNQTTFPNDILQNATSPTNVPYETFSTDATFSSYSSEYIAEVDIAVEQIPRDDWPTIERRLDGILGAGFVQSTRAHLRQNTKNSINFEPNSTVQNIETKVLGTKFEEGLIKLLFVTTFDEQLVPSDVVAKDVSLMTLSHMSAALQLPVMNIRGQHEIETNKLFRWWLVGVIVGSGLILIAFGWCCLFCYYNTCGRPVSIYQKEETENGTTDMIEFKSPNVPNIVVTKCSPDIERAVEHDEKPDNASTTKQRTSTRFVTGRKQRYLQPKAQQRYHRYSTAPRAMTSSATRSLVVASSALQELKLAAATDQVRLKSADIHSQRSAILNNDVALSPISTDVVTTPPEDPSDSERWSPYAAGDFIAATYGIGPNMSHHPSPMPSTENGVIQLAISPRIEEKV